MTVEKGANGTLAVNVLPANATNKRLFWNSSNTSVLSVDSNGKITALKEGTAVIMVSSQANSNLSDTCTITVKDKSNNTTSNTTSSTTNTTDTDIGTNAKAYLDALQKISDKVKQAYKTSKPWKYGWIKPHSFSYHQTHTRKTTCIGMVSIGLIEVGAFKDRQYIQTPRDGFDPRNGAGSGLKKNFKLTKIKYKSSLYKLIKNGKIKPGDIIIYKAHENVYAGNYNGTYKFYDGGRQQTAGKCAGCRFKTFGPVKKSNRNDVYAIYSWK